MSPVFSVVILFCIGMVTVCHACMCLPTDPQDEFCKADIVMRARVWSEPRDAAPTKGDEFSFLFPDQVYTLKIVEVFKGNEKVKQLPGVSSIGVRGLGVLIDLHTPTRFVSCSFMLQKGKEYLMSGFIHNEKLRSSFCDLRLKWTPQLRALHSVNCVQRL